MGHVEVLRLFSENPLINFNAVDEDENTPLHLAAEAGYHDCIIFLIKEAAVDHTIKNKFGYLSYDIAMNLEIRQLFDNLLGAKGHQSVRDLDDAKNSYGRKAFNGVLLHNDRVSQLKRMMHKFG